MIFVLNLGFYFNFILSFLIFGGLCTCKDFLNKEKFNIVKIQDKSSDDIYKTYKKILPLVFFNLFISSLPLSLLFYNLIDSKNLVNTNFSFYKFLFDIILYRFLIDLFFYICHRTFHSKYFYKYHKVHHEIKAPIGISALYLHPVDFLFGNIIPIFLPCFILQSHIYTIHFLLILTIFNLLF